MSIRDLVQPHGVTTPSPSRPRATEEEVHAMLHNADATLSHELHTLQRLQAFYEEHTFDTQGPYADLFAVLLSSCKHLVDINTQLVHTLQTQGAASLRQQAVCDALCEEVAQHKADIKTLYAASAHASGGANACASSSHHNVRTDNGACTVNAGIEKQRASDTCARSASSSSSTRDEGKAQAINDDATHTRTTPTEVRSSSIPPLPTAASLERLNEVELQHRAWAELTERRLDDVQAQLATLLMHAETPSPSPAAPAEPSRNRDGDATASDDVATTRALLDSLTKWKQQTEEVVGDRLDYLTKQVNALERAVRLQQRQTRWMGGAVDGDADPSDEAEDRLGAPRGSPSPNGKAAGNPPMKAADPPAAVTHWLHTQLHQWEEEWQHVLEDVQDALLAQQEQPEAAPPPLRRSSSWGNAHAIPASSSPPPPLSAVVPLHRRSWFTNAIHQLLLYEDAAKHKTVVDEATQYARRTDAEMQNVRARLEVLEVYAPHRYAVATRPPVLGVELEDVAEPRLGVRLCTVYQGYLADKAGLSVGDVVVGVSHHAVQSRAQLYVLLAELTRDYNARCRIQIEEGFMRHFAAPGVPVDQSIFTPDEVMYEDGGMSFELDHALHRARAEAASATYRAGSAASLRYRGNGTASTVANAAARPIQAASSLCYPQASQHKNLLSQCLPFFELALHVVRDGRLRDVTLLVPPSDALQSAAEY